MRIITNHTSFRKMKSLIGLVNGEVDSSTSTNSSDEDSFSVESVDLNVAFLYTATHPCFSTDSNDNVVLPQVFVNKRVISLSDKLKRSFPAEIAKQKQVIAPSDKRRFHRKTSSDPKKVTPHQRAQKFSGEQFTIIIWWTFVLSSMQRIN